MRLSHGITALEAVIGIVGIIFLVYTVLPYYLRLQEQARTEMITWTGSSLSVAVALVRAQAKLAGATGEGSVAIEKRPKIKTKIAINQELNPIANSQGIVQVIDVPDTGGKLDISYEVEPGARMVIYSVQDTSHCKVTYRENLFSGLVEIVEDTADCS